MNRLADLQSPLRLDLLARKVKEGKITTVEHAALLRKEGIGLVLEEEAGAASPAQVTKQEAQMAKHEKVSVALAAIEKLTSTLIHDIAFVVHATFNAVRLAR